MIVNEFRDLALKNLNEQIGTYFLSQEGVCKLTEQVDQLPSDFNAKIILTQKKLIERIDKSLEGHTNARKRKNRVERLFSNFIVSSKFPEIQRLQQELR